MFTDIVRPSAVDVLRPFTVGDQFYADTTSTLAKRAIGTTNQVYIVTGGVPVWSSAVSLTTLTVVDSGFTIVGSSDATKTLKFEVDAQSAGADLTIDTGAQTTDRTLTVPVLAGNRTLALIDQAQTFAPVQTFTLAPILTALTASRLVRTDASKALESNAALTATQLMYADANGWPTGNAGATIVGGTITLTGNINALSGLFDRSSSGDYFLGRFSGNVRFQLETDGSGNCTMNVRNSSGSAYFNLTTTSLTLNSTVTSGLAIQATTGTTLALSSTDASAMTNAGGTRNAGRIVSTGATAGVGYATGAGGTVTQGSGSGKATTVVLNTVCGTITMDGAALNADTTVAFTFTNSAIAATDLVVMQHSSAGTLGAYNFAVTPAGGSATVSVRNVTPGNLSEAIVIRFAIIKAVTS